MKITVNARLSQEALNVILKTQKEKIEIIDEFCKKENIELLLYKDAELEYEFKQQNNKNKVTTKKVEVRTNAKRDKIS